VEKGEDRTSHTKSERLEITPRIGVQFGWRDIQDAHNTYGKLVKRKVNMRVNKEACIYEEEV